MASKRPKPEEIVTKLRQVEVLSGQGMPRLDAIRQIGVTKQTYNRWKKKYGGMGVDQLKEMKRLLASDLNVDCPGFETAAISRVNFVSNRLARHPF